MREPIPNITRLSDVASPLSDDKCTSMDIKHIGEATVSKTMGLQLCPACLAFDFGQLFLPLHPLSLRTRKDYIYFHYEDKFDSACSACRFFQKLSPGAASLKSEFAENASYETVDGSLVEAPQLTILFGNGFEYRELIAHPLLHPPLRFDTKTPERLLSARLVKDRVDPWLLDLWLATCNSSHSQCCVDLGDSTYRPLRLIDTQEHRIVEPAGAKPYVALSYVWGDRETPQLKLSSKTSSRLLAVGGLGDGHIDIPTTIRDAITLCQSIGRRYLWVDALCMMQDSPEMLDEVQQMHNIYAAAEFTIFACGGDNSWSGLSGISKRQVKQKTGSLDGKAVAISLGHLSSTVIKSAWYSRAWTLQEMFFSRRRLIFTVEQVFFECFSAKWREDRFLEAPEQSNVRHRDTRDYFAYRIIMANTRFTYPMYETLVEMYSQQYLTNSIDNLNAFAGISTWVSKTFDTQLFWGIPVKFLEYAISFMASLEVESHDEAFPSWAWAAWLGQREDKNVKPPGITYQRSTFDSVIKYSLVQWNRLADFKTYTRIDNCGVTPLEQTAGDTPFGLEPYLLQAILSLYQGATKLDSCPAGLSQHDMSKLLVFRGSCAWVEISPTGYAKELGLTSDARVVRQSKLYKSAKKLDSGKMGIELLLLCVAWREELQRTQFGMDWPCLRALAISTDERGVSRRVDLVELLFSIRNWLHYRPVTRTVFLI